MSSPQIENGYMKIATELLPAFYTKDLNQTESKIVWAIISKTYGWNKKEEVITNKQICEMTGLIPQQVSKFLKRLKSRKIVIQTDNFLGLNKNYYEWLDYEKKEKKLSKQITKEKLSKQITKVIQTDNKSYLNRQQKVIQTDNYKSWIVNLQDGLQDSKYKEIHYIKDTIRNTGERTKKTGDNLFDFFWVLYPNKKSQKTAYSSWKKLKLTEELFRTIIYSLLEHVFCDQWTRDNGQFIPYPTTWLNQERWNDEAVNEPEVILNF